MLREESQLWERRVVWQTQRLSHICAEVFGDGPLRQLRLQPWRNHQTQTIVEGNQPLVKGCVVERRKRKAVANIQPLGNVSAPRKDVRSNQQLAHSQLSDATTPAKVVQHGVAEIVLPPAQLHVRRRLGRASRWPLAHA